LKFDWKEAGGPAVRKPGAKGFGSTLIDTAIPGAQVKREFRPEGFVCTIEVPLTEVPEVSTARRT
jgi:two-component system CheB/CheR fusion protein